MIVWRLSAASYASTAFSGEGAKRYGGRWSPPGLPMTYSAESRSLALVEILAGIDEPERLFRHSWVLVAADIPDGCIEKPSRFPEDWRRFPHSPSTQAFGAQWAQAGRSAALRVPSAVVPGEFNYLLNPVHPDFAKIKIGKPEPFRFDPRLK